MPTVDEWSVARAERTKATLHLDAPEGAPAGATRLSLYARVGSMGAKKATFLTDPVPVPFNGALDVDVPAAPLQKPDAVFVEATVVLKQPAQQTGKVKVTGTLTMGQRSSKLGGTFELAQGDTGGLIDLTWWMVEP